MLTAAANWQVEWQKSCSFGSPTFQVNHQYIREMARFGILPENAHAMDVDPYETDQRYWEMFHNKPKTYEDRISTLPPEEKRFSEAPHLLPMIYDRPVGESSAQHLWP